MTNLTDWVNFNVDKVSQYYDEAVDIVAIIIVFELPPKQSYNKYVNFEFLYGIWDVLFLSDGFSFIN